MKQIRVYVRIALIVAAVVAVGLVLFKNRNHRVSVWFFGLTDPNEPVNVLWLMLCTAAATLAAWWVLSLGRGLLRDFREVRADADARAAAHRLQQRQRELDERERRIDEKVHRAIRGDEPTGKS